MACQDSGPILIYYDGYYPLANSIDVCPFVRQIGDYLLTLFLGTFAWKCEIADSLPRYFGTGSGIVKNTDCGTMGLSRGWVGSPCGRHLVDVYNAL